MAVRIVREKGDPVLLQVANPVRRFDPTLVRLIEDMFETMKHYNGVGLAAPQVGISKQVVVIDTGEPGQSIAIINPEITVTEGLVVDVEGCLSVPGVYGEVERPEQIVVKFMDALGEAQELKANGLLARALQHEVDHLKGVLFVEHVIRYVPAEELESDV